MDIVALEGHASLIEAEIIDCRVARDRDELVKAYHLVYKEYLKREYTKENPSGLRFSIHNVLPATTTFIAVTEHQEIISTATVVPDSPLGLPMDRIYSSELTLLRGEGARLCEITMLATDMDYFKGIFFMPSFFKILLDYVRDVLQAKYMCILINPRYKLIFERLLFKSLGEQKPFQDVNNAPAMAKYVDVASINQGFSQPGRERLYNIFVARSTPPEKFSRKLEFSQEDLEYFFIHKSQIFKTASDSQLTYLKTCYPAYSF